MSVLQQNLANFEAHCELSITIEDDDITLTRRTFKLCSACNKPTLIHDLPIGENCKLAVLTPEQISSIEKVITTNEGFIDQEKLIAQEKVRKKLICDKCHLSFLDKKEMNNHMLSVHSERHVNNGYNCQQCESSYETKDDLDVHMKSVHVSLEDQPIVCEFCDMQFNNEEDMLTHKTNVHQPVHMNSVPGLEMFAGLGNDPQKFMQLLNVQQMQLQQELKLQKQQQDHQHRMFLLQIDQKQKERDEKILDQMRKQEE